MKDLEDEIPTNNLQLSQGLSELRVKVVKRGNDGFVETNIQRLKVQRTQEQGTSNGFIRKPYRPIANTISLSVEDVKLATPADHGCWKAFNYVFRRVLVYGKVDVLNIYSRDNRTCYKFLIDDGSENIIGTMKVTREAKTAVSAQMARLTLERNKLKHHQKVGMNLDGVFYPPDSEECQSVFTSIATLQNAMLRNIRPQKKDFQQGPVAEKALIHGYLYSTSSNELQLNVIDISLNDTIELAWKRQLNKLYLKEYLKPQV